MFYFKESQWCWNAIVVFSQTEEIVGFGANDALFISESENEFRGRGFR